MVVIARKRDARGYTRETLMQIERPQLFCVDTLPGIEAALS